MAKVEGILKDAFLELLITDPDENRFMHLDPMTWDSSIKTGKLNINGWEEIYSCQLTPYASI
ncbi:MAG: hypothetical protein GEU26_06440 [Nitrososphaeraceae archaeon]|nr:hypothetical protein [Nitrososphaeraceae archaeon]